MSKPPKVCALCKRNPDRMNSEIAECSHVDCPERHKLTVGEHNDLMALTHSRYSSNRIKTSDGDTQ